MHCSHLGRKYRTIRISHWHCCAGDQSSGHESGASQCGSACHGQWFELQKQQQQQQQYSLFSQVSWGRLEMKPEINKFKVQAH